MRAYLQALVALTALTLCGAARSESEPPHDLSRFLLNVRLIKQESVSGLETPLGCPRLTLAQGFSSDFSSYSHHFHHRTEALLPELDVSFTVAFTPKRLTRYGWLFQIETFSAVSTTPHATLWEFVSFTPVRRQLWSARGFDTFGELSFVRK